MSKGERKEAWVSVVLFYAAIIGLLSAAGYLIVVGEIPAALSNAQLAAFTLFLMVLATLGLSSLLQVIIKAASRQYDLKNVA